MKESSSYSLHELPKWYPLREYRRRLVIQGKATKVIVDGDEIGLHMESGNLALLATSYDYFDGCHHWIYPIKDGRPIDQLRMPDEFGFIHEVAVVTAREVAFGYFGTDDRWNLTASESGFCSYSVASMLRRPNRFFLAKRHISISRTKRPRPVRCNSIVSPRRNQPPQA